MQSTATVFKVPKNERERKKNSDNAVYASCAGGGSRANLQEVVFHFQPALDAITPKD